MEDRIVASACGVICWWCAYCAPGCITPLEENCKVTKSGFSRLRSRRLKVLKHDDLIKTNEMLIFCSVLE